MISVLSSLFLLSCDRTTHTEAKPPKPVSEGVGQTTDPVTAVALTPVKKLDCKTDAKQSIVTPSGLSMSLIRLGNLSWDIKTQKDRHEDEEPHPVKLTHFYYMSTFELTQSQWVSITGENPTPADECGLQCPVHRVTWCDAI